MTDLEPRRPVLAGPDEDWPAIQSLIHEAFAYMTPLLGHPANAMKVTPETLAGAREQGAVFLIKDSGRPIASLFTRPSRDFADALYLGGLAVGAGYRGQGLARQLIAAAEDRARADGYAALTLDTGRVLTDLHAFFGRCGFALEPGEGEVISFRKLLA